MNWGALLSRLHHPTLVPLTGFGQQKDICYVVTEYVLGKPLLAVLEQSPLGPQEALELAIEILVDRNSIEIFGNTGRVYMPIGGILPEDNKTLELFARDGDVKTGLLEIFELNSIWK